VIVKVSEDDAAEMSRRRSGWIWDSSSAVGVRRTSPPLRLRDCGREGESKALDREGGWELSKIRDCDGWPEDEPDVSLPRLPGRLPGRDAGPGGGSLGEICGEYGECNCGVRGVGIGSCFW